MPVEVEGGTLIVKWNTLLACASVSLLAVPVYGLATEKELADRPNLLMIFTDDQRHDAIGYTGNDAVQTPNLDRLAKSGLVFRNCFVNTSICAVNRANLLSGQYPCATALTTSTRLSRLRS